MMQRNEIQEKTGLTRKALIYYEEKGLIHPKKAENGYREYSDEDYATLRKIALYRKLDISVQDIMLLLEDESKSMADVLRDREIHLSLQERKNALLSDLMQGVSEDDIFTKLQQLEREETIYTRLMNAFPDYFGQLFFLSYQPYFNEPVSKEGEEAFNSFIEYLDSLDPIVLDEDEKQYLDQMSRFYDVDQIKKINHAKEEAIEDVDTWMKEHAQELKLYQEMKDSDMYRNSPMKRVQDKIQNYLVKNHYYEKAIPLLCQFSQSYRAYYEKLLKANEVFLRQQE